MPNDLLVTVKAAHAALLCCTGKPCACDENRDILVQSSVALVTRCEQAEAAYQEAQITIAGLEAERDAARVSLANVQAENANNAGLLEVIERQGVEAAAMQQRYNEVVEQRDWARYKLDKLRHAEKEKP